MRGNIATLLGTLTCLAVLCAWFYTAPAAGSGWILFVTILVTIWFLYEMQAGFGVIMTIACGAAWWLHSELPPSGWLLFLGGVCALSTFSKLMESAAYRGRQRAR